MKKIKDMVDKIEEELEGAKGYAENFVDRKAKNDSQWANRFKEMANDELKHAGYLHELAVADIEQLNRAVTPPQEMLDRWSAAHNNYVEDAAWIKQMLTL